MYAVKADILACDDENWCFYQPTYPCISGSWSLLASSDAVKSHFDMLHRFYVNIPLDL